MLRNLLVFALMIVGVAYAVQSPFYALVLYLWYAYFRPDVWAWSEVFRSIDFSFYVSLYTIAATLLSRQKLRFDLHVVVMLLFGLHALAAALASGRSELCLIAWVKVAKSLVVTYLIAVLVTDRSKFRIVLMVVGLSLAFEAAKQGWAEMILRPGSPNANPMTFLGDNNAVAVGMLMLVPILGVLAKTEKHRWLRFGLNFLLIGVVYRALSTYSRGGFVSAAVLAAVYWLRSRKKLTSLVPIVVVAGVVIGVMPDAYWQRMQTTLTYEEVGEPSALGRLHFWQVALEMANKHPLVGVGPGAYRVEYDQYDFSYGQHGSDRAVHSTWFGVLAEQGYVGFLLYVALFFLAFRNAALVRRLVKEGAAEAELSHYAAMIELGLIVFVTGSSFISLPEMEFPYHYVGFSMALRGVAIGQREDRKARLSAPA